MWYLKRSILILLLLATSLSSSLAEPEALSDEFVAVPDSAEDVNGFEWKAAFNTSLGKSGSLDNPLPDMFFGWVLTLDDSMKMWKGQSLKRPGNCLVAAVATPSWLIADLIMPGKPKRTIWRLQAGPSVGSPSVSANVTEYYQSLLRPGNTGISVSSYWLHTDLEQKTEQDVRSILKTREDAESAGKLYGGFKTFGAIGWGIKFYPPYKGDYIDYSGECHPQEPESTCVVVNTSDYPLDGLIQHYFRAGVGVQLGKHIGLSGSYTMAYHDVRKFSRDAFETLFGHHPERNGFQYLILNLQIALNPDKINPQSGGWYLDLTFFQQTEHDRWVGTPFDDREVLTVGLRKDLRELPLAFSN